MSKLKTPHLVKILSQNSISSQPMSNPLSTETQTPTTPLPPGVPLDNQPFSDPTSSNNPTQTETPITYPTEPNITPPPEIHLEPTSHSQT